MREINLNIKNQRKLWRDKPKSSLAKVKLASARRDLNEQMVHKGGDISTSMVLIDLRRWGSG